jgi:hypothetical protein
MVLKTLLDTNAILYLLGGRLVEPLEPGEYFASVITEIELLSYPSLDVGAERQIRALLSEIGLVELTPPIRNTAIQLRRQYELKVPDAIIAGTALVLDAEILTNDPHLLRIPGLRGRSLRLKEAL